MGVGGKILAGAATTALLAVVGHYATGDKYVSGLEQAAQTELTAQGMNSVSVALARDPLSRSAILDGEVSDDLKQKAMAAVTAIPGISSARWKGADDSDAATSGTDDVDPAAIDKIATCQNAVDKITESKKISFRSGSAYVSPISNRILDEVTDALKPCTGLSIAVSGHTDDNGDARVNKTMSQERADRIRQGLIDRGIAENLVTATGYGSEKPLAKGNDSAADTQNRRIEFELQAAKSDAANDAAGQQGE